MEDMLQRKPLPRRADFRVSLQVGQVANLQEAVEQAAVTDIYLGCFDLPFFKIFKPRWQHPNHVGTGKDIEVSPRRIFSRVERSGKLPCIPHLTMIMGHHRPESPKGFRGNGNA